MNPVLRASLAELLGTFTLTFIGAGAIIATGGQNLVAIALAHGLALAMAVYATNGHINPAVTLTMYARTRIDAPMTLGYLAGQLAGAVLAAFLLKELYPNSMAPEVKLGATLGSLSTQDHVMRVLVIEAILTFFLLITIFGVAVDKRAPKNVYGFAIGLTVCMDILAAGALTGASMNPARSFGPALIGGFWDIHWAYWLGPILGGLVGGYFYDLVFMSRADEPAAKA